MPVNPDREIAFVHIPRTGGTFVEHLIGVHEDRPGAGLGRKYHTTDLARLFGGDLQHLTFSDMVMLLKGKARSFRWLAIVRDPEDRMRSILRYSLDSPGALNSSRTLLRTIASILRRSARLHTRAFIDAITGRGAYRQVRLLRHKDQHLLPQACYIAYPSNVTKTHWIPPLELYPFEALNELPFADSAASVRPNASGGSAQTTRLNAWLIRRFCRIRYRGDYRLHAAALRHWRSNGAPLVRYVDAGTYA